MKSDGSEAASLRRPGLAIVLDRLVTAEPVATAAELMAATGLSRPTVHSLCNELIELGLALEVDGRRPEGPGRAGRTARTYTFNNGMAHVLGVDLGDHKVSVSIADLAGNQINSRTETFPSLALSGQARIAVTRRLMRSVLRSAGLGSTSVLCAAVGVAAPVDRAGRIVGGEPGYLPGLAGMNLASNIGRGYDWPVLVENDANLAALGEQWRGVGLGVDNAIVLLSGERLGAGLIAGGQLVRGHHHVAGELAFLKLVSGVEDTTGIAGLAQTLGRQVVTNTYSSPGAAGWLYTQSNGDANLVHADTVTDAAGRGALDAIDVLHDIAERMARVIAVLATLLDPELIVFAGGGADAFKVIHDDIMQRLPAFIPQPPRIAASTLGDRVVLDGATKLALDHAHHQLFKALKDH